MYVAIRKKISKLVERIKNRMLNIILCFADFVRIWKEKFYKTKSNAQQYEDMWQDDESDLNAWEIVTGGLDDDYFPKETTTGEQVKIMKDNYIGYSIQNMQCIIKLQRTRTQVEEIQYVTIEENVKYSIISDGSLYGATTKVKYQGKTYNVTCSHVIGLMEIHEALQYKQINPHILVTGVDMVSSNISWTCKVKDEIKWYTKNMVTNKHLFAVTSVTSMVNCFIKVKGRPRLKTVAVVVCIPMNKEVLYSGTVMDVDGKPYIVTYVWHNTETTVTTIVAIAMFAHEYEIIVDYEAK